MQVAKEVCEGTTYQTDIGIQGQVDVTTIPDPVSEPDLVQLSEDQGWVA